MAHEPEAGGAPAEAKRLGLKYFLEVFIAREFIEGWIAKLRHTADLTTEVCKTD